MQTHDSTYTYCHHCSKHCQGRKYNHQKKIKLHLYDGGNIELEHDKSVAKSLTRYFEQGLVETIHSTEPDLELVFMELTGRKLGK